MKDYVLDKAYKFANEKHGNMLDDGGDNYFYTHVCHVVEILKRVTSDDEILAAGYLHDTVEDCGVTYEELVKEFTVRIADLVMEVTYTGKKYPDGHRPFGRLKTRDGIMIKYADRLNNISRMKPWSPARQQRYLDKSKFWRN